MDRLDTHENFPAGFREYLENYGWHFSKKMCEFAVSRMKDRNGKKIEPYSKDKVDALLKQYGIELKKDKGYDCVYVCNMALADYFGSSIPNPQYLAMFIRDYINDEDGYDGVHPVLISECGNHPVGRDDVAMEEYPQISEFTNDNDEIDEKYRNARP